MSAKTSSSVQLLPRRDFITPVLWVILGMMVVGMATNLVVNPRWRWDVVAQYIVSEQILTGLGTTLWLTFLSGIVGIVIGLITAAMRLSKRAPLRIIASVYVALSRAIPALVLILFVYFFAALVPNIELGIPFLPPFFSVPTNTVITQFAAAVIGLTFILGAHLGEIFRGGILAVDRGQVEAARALGMHPLTTQFRVVLPQAIRVSTPAAANDLISLFKNTSLVSIIGYTELLTTVQSIYARTFETIPLLLVACVWYMALTLLAMGAQRIIERRMSRGFSR
jgi:polar amino acid transport system permease protein